MIEDIRYYVERLFVDAYEDNVKIWWTEERHVVSPSRLLKHMTMQTDQWTVPDLTGICLILNCHLPRAWQWLAEGAVAVVLSARGW